MLSSNQEVEVVEQKSVSHNLFIQKFRVWEWYEVKMGPGVGPGNDYRPEQLATKNAGH